MRFAKTLLSFFLLVSMLGTAVFGRSVPTTAVRLVDPLYDPVVPGGVHSWQSALAVVQNRQYGRSLGYADYQISEFAELCEAMINGNAKEGQLVKLSSGREAWAMILTAGPGTFYTKMVFAGGVQDNVIPAYASCGVWGLHIVAENRRVLGYHILARCGNPAKPATASCPTGLVIERKVEGQIVDRPVFKDREVEVVKYRDREVPIFVEICTTEVAPPIVQVVKAPPPDRRPEYRQYVETPQAGLEYWRQRGEVWGLLTAWLLKPVASSNSLVSYGSSAVTGPSTAYGGAGGAGGAGYGYGAAAAAAAAASSAASTAPGSGAGSSGTSGSSAGAP